MMFLNRHKPATRQCPSRDGSGAGLLVDYCAGTLVREDALWVEDHIAECELCRRVCEAQHVVWDGLDEWDDTPVPAEFNRAVFERIAAFDRQPRWRRWWASRPPLAWKPAVAGVTAVVAVLVMILWLHPAPVAAPPAHETQTTVRERVDPDTLEQALQDMEMLQRLSAGNGGEL